MPYQPAWQEWQLPWRPCLDSKGLAACLPAWLAGWLACLLVCLLASLCPPRECGHAIQHRHTCGQTMGNKRRQTSGRRTHNTGPLCGDNGRQGLTRPWGGGHTIQHGHTCGDTRGDKTSGRRTHHTTQAHMCGDNGRQLETRGDQTGQTIQQRETRRETRPPEANKRKQEGRQCETSKARQDLGKVGTSSNTCTHLGRQLETSWETRGDKSSGMRTHHPTQAHPGKANTPSNTGTHMRGDNGDQDLGRRTHLPKHAHVCHNGRQWETRGDKGSQDFGKADTPSNTGTCGETRGDKTSGRRTHHPTPRWTPYESIKNP